MSESTASAGTCPRCRATLPSTATNGLCPRCLMAEAMVPTQVDTEPADARQTFTPEELAPSFPQLEIHECLGRGGMGVVYKARQKSLNRMVALKLLAPERVGDPEFAARFSREAHALAALNHPNIVTVYDFGQAGGFYFLLMEFVDGVNLRQLLRTRKFTPEEALTIVPPLCDALQFAHERGFVHRDIKPENLLLDRDGHVKIADFGIAKMLSRIEAGADRAGIFAADAATQAAVGTPGYSAPEQHSNPQHVDSRADIYSLGVVFYEMLTGERPGSRLEAPSKKVQVDVRLDEIVLRALEEVPERRYQQVSELKTMVETLVTGKPNGSSPLLATQPMNTSPRKKLWLWTTVAAVVVACVCGGLALAFYRPETRIQGIPPDWTVMSGTSDQWHWANNAINGHSANGDSILASTKQYGDITISTMATTTNRGADLAFRMQDAYNGYILCFSPDDTPWAADNGSHLQLKKRVAGGETDLATFTRRGLPHTAKITLIARGPRIEVRWNDITVLRTNDSTFATGFIGVRVYGDRGLPDDATFSNVTFY